MNKFDPNCNGPRLISANQLAVIAGVITTFGDALATMAAVLAVEENNQTAIQEQQKQLEQDNQMTMIQNQLDFLTNELTKIKEAKK